MPSLNWNVFEGLPGAADSNFEMLCRAIIRRHYGRYGLFAALANQPGVEFHLKLHTTCDLGDVGHWYGWQCRWYGLPSGKALGNTRRKKIEKAITTTEAELPNLTDWVLWTRYPLTEGDQKWFNSIKTRMRLHQWTTDEVEGYLSGSAEILRKTYFGELVLTPDVLGELHKKALAPIRLRWQPEVHQTIDAERQLRRMLGEKESWDDLSQLADQLEKDAKSIETDAITILPQFTSSVVDLVKLVWETATTLKTAYEGVVRGDLDLLRQQLANRPNRPEPKLSALPHQLRASRQPAALSVTNSLADVRRSQRILREIDDLLGQRLVAVLADAGGGKTELAAQLTVAVGNRPAGILLHGRDLHARQNLDDLARGVVVHSTPISSMEALIEAVDAAGQRACQRIPIVIDGLNEAEDPRDWKNPLASIRETLQRYPYVLVVCTLRTAFANQALPEDLVRIEIPDFAHDTTEAVRRYFSHYKINATDAELPWGLLRHPLTLRLFCEVTNSKRDRVVGIEAMPGSLTGLFDRYLVQAAERIAELAPRTHRYFQADIFAAIVEIGTTLWDSKARSIELATIRCQLHDEQRPWNESIIQALEQDGVLLRYPGEERSESHIAIVYDALAGHIIANALIERHGRTRLVEWLKEANTISALTETTAEQHPLGTDILHGLAGLIPRRIHGQQLWQLLNEPLRTIALRQAADLEGAYLDAETVGELANLAVLQPSWDRRDLFRRLFSTRGTPNHPLNAEFLDQVLRPMAVAQRDSRWTEWVRAESKELINDLEWLGKRWQSTTPRNQSDRLRARWVMWLLTSTVRQLRDQATRTLYWFGRGDPAALFDLTLDSLAINDPYIPERMLAASYGVVMAHQLPEPVFAGILTTYLIGLRENLTGNLAKYPTNHWLARLYVQGTFTFARTYYPDAVPDGLAIDGRVSFASGPHVEPIPKNDDRAGEIEHTLKMDFENYTLGRLFSDRRNYDSKHAGHQAAVAHVLGTAWALGWRERPFGPIDNSIASDRFYRHEQAKIERYGKKYGWIGFYTYAGVLADKGKRPFRGSRLSDIDIDPSFPEPPIPIPIDLATWAKPTPKDDRNWIPKGVITVPDELLYSTKIVDQPGPWIAVAGDLYTEDQTTGRRTFGLLTTLLVADADADKLVEALNSRPEPGGWLPDIPKDYHTFAGEIPWSPIFAEMDDEDDSELYRSIVELDHHSRVKVEILAHSYAWESDQRAINNTGGALVPPRPFSKMFDLRGIPQSFDQKAHDGSLAAMSFSAPRGFDGRLLYLREDLVHKYAAGRRLIWFIWGERQLTLSSHSQPDWLWKLKDSNKDVWRYIRKGEELSPLFATPFVSNGQDAQTSPIQVTIESDSASFTLSPEQWDQFCQVLDTPPKKIPALQNLLQSPGLFDER